MPSGKQSGSRRARQRSSARQAPSRGRLVPIVLAGAAALAIVAVAFALRPSAAAPSASAPNAPPAVGDAGPAATAPTTGPSTGEEAPTQKTAVTIEDGAVRLDAGQFADRRARYYTVESAGKTLSFFVLKSSDGAIRAAFDACDVCYPAQKGYHQEGDVMVCNNCGNRFPSARINVEKGGCNPAPLVVRTEGDAIVIQAADLEAGTKYF
jgi:hypothetical protein